MKETKKVLVFIDWFLPGYKAGGPIQSVVNLIKHLGAEFDFYVVTAHKDLGEPEPYENITFNSWIKKVKCQVIYLDEKHQRSNKYLELFKERNYDFIYFNSLFSVNFTIKPLLLLRHSNNKIILAPRGMLGKGALQLKKRKKELFIKLFKITGFSKKITWHATAVSEAEEIKKHFGENSEIRIATNLSAVITNQSITRKKYENQLKLFFLSRISKKKNLLAALKILLKIDSEYRITLSVIGPIEDEVYWKECERVIKQMPQNISVNYLGAIPNYKLSKHLKEQHFMLLPTHHENFGHVIMESWQNACPVIISDKTPWNNLEKKKIGFDIPLEQEEDFIKALEKVAGMDQTEYEEWSNAALNFAKEYCNDPKAIEASRMLFT